MNNTVRQLLAAKGNMVLTIKPNATVYEALKVMAEKKVGALVVVHAGRVNGIITERDYARKIVLMGKLSKNTPVKEIMTRPALSVSPSHTVEDCMALMTEHRVRHLTVIDGGKLAGIVSIGDLVKSIISDQKSTIEELKDYISGAPNVQ